MNKEQKGLSLFLHIFGIIIIILGALASGILLFLKQSFILICAVVVGGFLIGPVLMWMSAMLTESEFQSYCLYKMANKTDEASKRTSNDK